VALGDTRALAGDLPGAREAYGQALRLAPDAVEIQEKMALVGSDRVP
jgi:cytochrome c-type biogenesis protein CcmH/NrfG